jgi:KTSC domain-containing protein
MKRQPVDSSSLVSIGYDSATRVLEVEFRKGGIYQFLDVPEFLFRGLSLSQSKGTFFNRNIEDRFAYFDVTANEIPPQRG